MTAVRVVVVEARRLVREVLARRLAAEPDLLLVGAVERVEDLAPGDPAVDLLVQGPGRTGAAARRVRVLRYHDETGLSRLITAVRHREPAIDADGPAGRLTDREREVLAGVADGLSSREIAATLGITGKSVDNHKQRIFQKLGVQSQAHAVSIALAAGPLPRAAADLPG